jgi:NitT/TauT family transport system permease protein
MNPFVGLLFFISVLWELASRLDWISPSLFSSPTQILVSLKDNKEIFLRAFFETFKHSLYGFLLSLGLGYPLALGLILTPRLKRAVLPLAVFFQTLPIVAIAPLLVIYFGFGAPTVVASSFFVSVFPVLASSLIGLENINPEKRDLFKMMGASHWQTLIKLQIPSSLSTLYSGLQTAGGLAIVGAVAGEFVAGSGLGSLIDTAKSAQRVDQVFSCFLLLALLGALFLKFQTFLFHQLNRNRPFVRGLRNERPLD